MNIEGYFNLMADVQKRRGGNKSHQEIQNIARKNKSKEVKEVKKKEVQLKLF
jgi:hypothetical protein